MTVSSPVRIRFTRAFWGYHPGDTVALAALDERGRHALLYGAAELEDGPTDA